MLWVLTNLKKIEEFREEFYKAHETLKIIDLSKISLKDLANESESIVNHHKNCAIFIGYLEPGWMLELCDQTRMRKLFRKFPVAMITHYIESLPFSWKNEIDTIYIRPPVNGNSNSIDNGCALQDKLEI